MKQGSLRKIYGLILAVCVLALLPGRLSSAAETKPGRVKNLKATVDSSDVSNPKVKLTWSEASKATGYYVYMVDPETSDIVKRVGGERTGLSCTLAITGGQIYSFQVYSFIKKGSEITEAKNGSPVVDVEVKTLNLVCTGNKCAYLGWTKVKGAEYYNLYQYNPNTKKYKLVKKNIKDTTYKVSNLKVGKDYYYVVRSVSIKDGEPVESENSNRLKVKGRKAGTVLGRLYVVVVNKNVTAKDTETGKSVKVKQGTKVAFKQTTAKKTTVTVIKTGQKVKLSRSSLNPSRTLYIADTYDEYDRSQSEAFVNGKKYTSKTKYLIWVSQYTASVHFFTGSKGHWRQTHVAPCVIGGTRGFTVRGEFELLNREGGGVTFYWSNSMNWGQAFHALVDRNRWGSYSAGCVRLASKELNLVRSLPLGTTVISY